MIRKSLFAAALFFSIAQTNLEAANVSPINSPNKAWAIRYGKQQGQGNKRQDLAVMLRLKTNGDGQFTGTLLRFDRVTGGKYKTAPDNPGRVTITGNYSAPGNANNLRKPVRITGVGSFVNGKGVAKIVYVKGLYHPGNDPDSRDDDRMSVQIDVRDVKQRNKNRGLDGINGDLESDMNVDFINFMQADDPCEEEPDTDVLAEEPITEMDFEAGEYPADPSI
jgi:hypothetical protein